MRKIRTLTGVTIVSSALLALTACSGDGPTTILPTNAGTTPSAPSRGATQPSAPAIPEPLEPTDLVDDPCSSLTPEQTADLGVNGQGTETRVTTDGLKGCDWKFGANLEWKIQVAYVTPNSKNGLQNEYDQHAAGAFDGGYFEPMSVAGYPGVFSNVADTRPDGRCDLGVGINNETLLTVAVTGDAGKDNCRAASNVAERIIATINAGGQ